MMKPTLIMPETFEDCLTYAKQLRKLYEEYLKVSGGGDTTVITDLQKQMENVTQQINEINNELESLDIPNISENLNDIRTEITEIQNELLTKQNTLTFDDVPTENSGNPVTSTGLYGYLKKMKEDLLHLINQKENSMDVDEKINNIENNYPTNEELTEQLRNYETTEHANETFATKESLSGYETTTHANETFATKSDLQNVHIVVDDTVSSNSQNAVSSKGIYDFVTDQTADLATVEDLNTKQDTLTFDETPTLNSPNPATSGGIYDSIKAVKESMDSYTPLTAFDQYKQQVDADYLGKDEASSTYVSQQNLSALLDQYEPKAHAENTYATKLELNNYPTQQYVEGQYATKTELNTKQDLLVFDTVPKLGSTNPVTSEGIYNAIQNSGGDTNYNKLCSVKLRYSDDTNNPEDGYDQTVDILANGKDGDLIRYGYSDFDVQLSNPDYINHVIFEYLIINKIDIVPYNHVNTYPISFPQGEYGPGSGAAICKINSHVYIIDVLSIAFRASDNYIHTVHESNKKLPNGRFYMHIDNDTFKTLTKGHITYKFTLLI